MVTLVGADDNRHKIRQARLAWIREKFKEEQGKFACLLNQAINKRAD